MDNLPPQAPDIERVFLGAVMLCPAALEDVDISAEDFYLSAHRKIYQAALRLHSRGEPVDLHLLVEELSKGGKLEEIGGVSFLSGIVSEAVTAANAEYHARIIREKAIRRRIMEACQGALGRIHDEDLETLAGSLHVEVTGGRRRVQTIQEVVTKTVKAVEVRLDRAEELSGIPSGFREVDEFTDGWQPGNLIIVGGRPSMGKTAFVGACAFNAAQEGFKVHVVNVEMTNPGMVLRAISDLSGVNLWRFRKAKMEREQWEALYRAAGRLNALEMTFDDAAYTMRDIAGSIRTAVRKYGAELAIVDYLQLIRAEGDGRKSREREVGEMCTGLRHLAKHLGIPIICVAQLNRAVEAREKKRPTLADLRDSGQIEQDADIIGFLYRDHYYTKNSETKNVAELIFAKGREIGLTTIKLHFDELKTSFRDWEDKKS
jgi:replicative DNA helicase